MTITIERLQSQPSDFEADRQLQQDIRHLVDNLDIATHEIIYDYQEVEGCEYILIDTRKHHYQLKLHDANPIKGENSGKIELLKQQYLHDGRLGKETEVEIIMLPQLVAMITE